RRPGRPPRSERAIRGLRPRASALGRGRRPDEHVRLHCVTGSNGGRVLRQGLHSNRRHRESSTEVLRSRPRRTGGEGPTGPASGRDRSAYGDAMEPGPTQPDPGGSTAVPPAPPGPVAGSTGGGEPPEQQRGRNVLLDVFLGAGVLAILAAVVFGIPALTGS